MRIVGQENIADAFGVAPKTIVQWQEDGFPIAQRGDRGIASEYELTDCIAWLVKREVSKVQSESPKDRLARLQGDALEREAAKERGQLIPADKLEPQLRAAIISARERLRASRGALSRELVGKSVGEIERAIGQAHDDFLARMAQWRQADKLDNDDDDELPP